MSDHTDTCRELGRRPQLTDLARDVLGLPPVVADMVLVPLLNLPVRHDEPVGGDPS